MAIAFASVHSGTITTGATLTVSSVTGDTDQLYVLMIATRKDLDVSAVSGGGLTWTERVEQCSGRGQQGIRSWTAFGTPSGAPFSITITIASPSDRPAVGIVCRYTGAGADDVTEAVGHSTNGEDSATCTGGTDDADALITTTSVTDESLHAHGYNTRTKDLSVDPSPGAERANVTAGASGGLTRLIVFDLIKTPAGDYDGSATIDGSTDWCTAGVVIPPVAVAGASPAMMGSPI